MPPTWVTRWILLALRFLAVLCGLMVVYENRSPASAIVVISMLIDLFRDK